jgi:SAM-dependent methyltransferase
MDSWSVKIPTNNQKPDAAEAVQDFYERLPYPPPIDSLEKYQRSWQDAQRRRADFHLHWPAVAYREERSILIAGCGTSQAAKHAMRWPNAQVTGIDFSATSVRCTEELKRKYNLSNLKLHQLPIERVSELGISFDQIVSTGVLHHLANPDAGLAALHDVLNPDGAMHLMVYAPYGRTGIYMMQDFCRRLGIQATDEGIRELIAALKLLPRGHPLENLLREAPDFRHEAALADALLHPQDRAYSVPELFNYLNTNGLTFGRWVRQAPYSVHCGVVAKLPQAARMAKMPLADQYAAVELFRGTTARHSFIAYRSDGCAPQLIDFGGDAWFGYVPIRIEGTICIQERLPAGAAAVLINQTHTNTDLIMPIDATEKRMFDAIDGKRSIGEIANKIAPSTRKESPFDVARALFERLWWHDQVVFDTSRFFSGNLQGHHR